MRSVGSMSHRNRAMTSNETMANNKKKTDVAESAVRPSISLRLIRHAESRNNEVYRNARYIYRGGTPDFDQQGWVDYIDKHRSADPTISSTGKKQADKLADFLVPHLEQQASKPVQMICSPMRRTLETIRPTIQRLHKKDPSSCHLLVNGFYFESEGCHVKEKPLEGMTQSECGQVVQQEGDLPDSTIDVTFEGFPDPERGWWCNGTGPETRAESEQRAAQFYLWICEHLDKQLAEHEVYEDVFDAGVAVPGEEKEDEHDKAAPRQRKRRMALLIGHGDFMSLVLKRIVAGFGHHVENEGTPHRSAFTHFNTGITELEYFGHGRFLLMNHNQTPHFSHEEYSELRSGGSLKDGWSYLIPDDRVVLNVEVSVAFSDEALDEHVREQAQALKTLYLSSESSNHTTVETNAKANSELESSEERNGSNTKHFIVKRGLQVVGVATYDEQSGHLFDVAVRPSAGKEVSEVLLKSVRDHSKRLGRSGSLFIHPRSVESRALFQSIGFSELAEGDASLAMEI